MVAAALCYLIAQDANPGPYLDAAQSAAAWIRAERKSQGAGAAKDLSLYSGEAGVLVFFCELAHATKDPKVMKEVEAMADGLAKAAEGVKDPGLYTGLSGISFALECAGKLTGKTKYYKAASRSLIDAVSLAIPWLKPEAKDFSNDIVSGLAGIGCAILWHADAFEAAFPNLPDPTGENFPSEAEELRGVARVIGDRLIALAKPIHIESSVPPPTTAHPTPSPQLLSWEMSPGYPREMPNFSHGTAGVAYFLAQLGSATKEAKYLDAAKKGAAYLMSITGKDGFIYHHKPEGEDLSYLGWCHGPVGTARLFAILHKQTKDKAYGDWIDKASASMLKCGIPAKRTPGFWNNYGYCCGDAGVMRFFLDLYRLDQKPEQIAFVRKIADFLIAKGEKTDGLPAEDPPLQGAGGTARSGLKWTFAENRVSPKDVKAQTGLMQGAAGIGLAMLWLYEFDAKQDALVRFPDAPWRW